MASNSSSGYTRAINMKTGDPSLRISSLRVLDNKICMIIAPHLV